MPFPINLSLPWLIAFLIASCTLVAVAAIWIFTEWGDPVWKRYQEKELAVMLEGLEKELPILKDPKWGDPAKVKIAEASIEYLKRPDYQIKQIILKGQGNWAKGTSGTPVDRCMTCHIDEDKLDKLHPTTRDHFPFDVYGCTMCHEGQGRVLRTKEEAHMGLLRNRQEMMGRVQRPEEILALWDRMAKLSIQPGLKAFNFRDYNAAGEDLVYVGSFACLKCHRKLNPRHVERWEPKFKTWERVTRSKDYIEGDNDYRKKCLKCHTTGYDERTDKYSEENVTCESCHGPGEMFAKFMAEDKLAEAALVTHDVFSYEVCGRCHVPYRHDMREAMLVAQEDKEFSDWLAAAFDEESDELYAGISGEAEALGLDKLKGLKGVGDSLDAMLEDMRALLLEQEGAVQTAGEVEPAEEGLPHPLRAGLELPEPLDISAEEARAEAPEKLFITKEAS
ncbi:MAG: multiheme c-type cytochrome [Candidatus Brocadiales bacterium]